MGRAALQAEQRAWIGERDRCGAEVMCLVQSLGARSQALVVLAQGGTGAPDVPAEPGTAAPAGVGEAAGAPLFIAYVGNAAAVGRDWNSPDVAQRQRDALASIVYGSIAGTAAEEVFLQIRTLTEAEALDAVVAAGITVTPFV